MTRYQRLLFCSAALALSGCAGKPMDLPAGTQAYQHFPSIAHAPSSPDYVIGPLDRINVTVFGEGGLSVDQAQVDVSGNMLLPLIGKVHVADQTAGDLASDVRRRLGKYLVDPRVTVLVQSTVYERVTVEGSVNEAGVYQLQGRTTLLEMLAMAKGVSNTSDPRRIAVFRTVDDKRTGAVFDLGKISVGEMPDPELRAGDVVIVGNSPRRSAWHDFLTTAPALGIFVALANIR